MGEESSIGHYRRGEEVFGGGGGEVALPDRMGGEIGMFRRRASVEWDAT